MMSELKTRSSIFDREINLQIGLIIILVNLCWIWSNAQLYYNYHYTDLLYIYRVPGRILLMNSLLAFIGMLIGLKVIFRSKKLKQETLCSIGLVLIGKIVEEINIMF